MKIIKDFRNELLRRREAKLLITADKNPGIATSLKAIAEHFKVGEELIVVKALKSKFGRDSFLIDSFIYDSVSDKERIEPRKKEKKKTDAQATSAPAPAGGKK